MMQAADRERAEAWAERIAASLPPFTAAEAAEVGRIAAKLDARRRERNAAAKAA